MRILHSVLAVFIASTFLVNAANAQSATSVRFRAGQGDRQKLRVSDSETARLVEEGGGQLVADYGAFKIYVANKAAADSFGQRDSVNIVSHEDRIELNVGSIDTTDPTTASKRAAQKTFSGKRLHLVQFAGPVKPEWRDELVQAGVQIVSYIPYNAYIVYGDASALGKVQTLGQTQSHVQWHGAFTDADKLQVGANTSDVPRVTRKPPNNLYAIQLVRDPAANAETLQLIDTLKLAPVLKTDHVLDYVNVIVRLSPGSLPGLSAQPDVLSIRPYYLPKRMDERQDIIVSGQLSGNQPSGPGYLNWLASKGFTQSQFTASGFVVDVTDSGIDNGKTNANHFGLFTLGNTSQLSRVAYNRLEGTPTGADSTNAACDGHGNLNAHIIGGYVSLSNFPHTDTAGYRYGLGVCPFVKVGSSVIFDHGDPDSDYTSPDFEDLISRAYNDGARVSSDSWGGDSFGAYDVDAQAYDALVRDAQPTGSAIPTAGNQEMTIVFAAGNAGPNYKTVGTPGTAKNVITVGAAENVHSHATTNRGDNAAGDDGCATPDVGANSANDIIDFSSRGPCSDGRQKPEIVAPGTHITGGVGQQVKTMSGTGTALTCFDGSGVCGLTVGLFFPTNQQFYSTSSGTSHSTPAVAGGCALVYQYFLNNGLNAPSPAMVKAYLVNSARYMNGVYANDSLWSRKQGMGGMNLGLAFDGTQRILRDQVGGDIFTASGQSRKFTAVVASNNAPVRVTLSWTDAPGSTSGNSFNNNLDLTVTANGNVYRGNVFSVSNSAVGGSSDVKNNTESVFLPAGTTGAIAVVVTAVNINSDGVPNSGGSLDQDFALVIYNATASTSTVVGAVQANLIVEGCGVGNGNIDPNETVTLSVPVFNPGTIDATNVVLTLLATGGVTAPSSPVTNALLPAGATITNTFTCTATGSCGGTVTTTFNIDDASGHLGSGAFNFRLGSVVLTTTTNSNSSTITIRDLDTATPYPSTINVSGLAGTIEKVRVIFSGLSHTFPADISALLVGPGGQKVILMDAVSDGSSINNATLVFDDDATNYLPGADAALTAGTYKPSGGSPADSTPPAPPGPYDSDLPVFKGTSPNGTWSLYVEDFAEQDSGTIASGWKVAITVSEPSCCASNQPPVIAPIGNKSVTESNTLQFAVTATDPTDGDPITLSVSNAPPYPGVSFASTNGNGTFTWSNATPVGVYTTTFYAVDKDGAVSQAVTISVSPPAGPSTNIGGWTLIQSNASVNYTFPTGTAISAGGYVIVARSATKAQFQTYWGVTLGTNVTFLTSTGSNMPSINGAETYTLKNGSTLVDGNTPTNINPDTKAVQRKSAQLSATLTSSWTVVASTSATPGTGGTGNGSGGVVISEYSDATGTGAFSNEFVELYYDSGGTPSQSPPILSGIGNKSITISNTLQFVVNATPTDGDAVTLSVTNLPPTGAFFNATNESGTFVWSNAAPIGVYTTTFFAVDNDGTNSSVVVISVVPPTPAAGIWINEIHYDNVSGDSGEGVEVAGTAGLNLSSYAIYEYNGSGGAVYGTNFLSGTIDDESCGYGAVFFAISPLQNGDPDGVALVKDGTNVIQFLSYGGSFSTTRGPAAGLTSTDIGIKESGSTPVGFSLQLVGSGTNYPQFTWMGPTNNSQGSLNVGQNIVPCGGGDTSPILVITTLSQTVTFSVTGLVVGGTSSNLVGQILWTNSLTGGSGSIPAAASWLIDSVPVNVGVNVIIVGGTNNLAVATNASISITRQAEDSDGDGIDDTWELQYFGNLTNASNSTTSDNDQDSFIDLHEFLAGTVPTDSNSFLKAVAVSNAPAGTVVIKWASASNKIYSLNRTTNALSGYTSIASNVVATPQVNIYTDATATNAVMNLYRIELQ